MFLKPQFLQEFLEEWRVQGKSLPWEGNEYFGSPKTHLHVVYTVILSKNSVILTSRLSLIFTSFIFSFVLGTKKIFTSGT